MPDTNAALAPAARALDTMGPFIRTSTPHASTAAAVVAWAITHPGSEVLLAAGTPEAVERLATCVEEVVLASGAIRPGRGARVHSPFRATLANESRITAKVVTDDTAQLRGINPHIIWWVGALPRPVGQNLTAFLRPQQ